MTIHILIVDDHAIVRSGIRMLLSTQPGMQVIGEASNGSEAYDLAISLKPEVILMDIAMSGENGLSATFRLKQALPDTEILILTMFEDRDLLFNALKAGASGYVLKSAQESDLMTAIRTVHRGEVYLYPSAEKHLIREYILKAQEGETAFDFSGLSARELEVIALSAKGYSNKDIGKSLHLSVKTVETHKSKIMEKLRLSTRQELVSYAYKHGLLHFD